MMCRDKRLAFKPNSYDSFTLPACYFESSDHITAWCKSGQT